MKNLKHISNLLNKKLKLIGSKLILDSDTNDIGEQIASKTIDERYLEIIRLENEKSVFITFFYKTTFLGSNTITDIDKITKSVYYFLELKLELKDFYEKNQVINSPFDISNIFDTQQILISLKWIDLFEENNTNGNESKKWLSIKKLSNSLKTLTSSKGMIPYRSLNRLCFSINNNQLDKSVPCIWSTENKGFVVGFVDGKIIKSGSEDEVLKEFEKIIKTTYNTIYST
jgi:hypothetical protein